MADPRVPVLDLGPELDEVAPALDEAWRRVLRSRQFIMGPEVDGFEREVATYLGVRHAIGVNSGTDALVISLRSLGVGSGDEVVTVPFSFFATAEAICSVGATPVFVDIDPATYTLDAAQLETAITTRTRAVLPVHLYGHAADMERIGAHCQRRGVALVEDVAQAFGGTYGGKRLGTFGATGAFSFFPSKNLAGLGDGGLVATNDDRLADVARMLRAHGGRRKYFNEVVAYNSRLDALQAAFLRAKLPHVDAWNEGRRRAAQQYNEMLRGTPNLVLPVERAAARHVYHQFTVRVTGGRRDELRERLREQGIETAVYYPCAIHELPIFGRDASEFPHSTTASREVLSLPIGPKLPCTAIERVASAIRRALG